MTSVLGPPRSVAKMLQRAAPILARLPRPAEMVEVGVSVGILADHLLAQRVDLTWHGVDPWLGRERQPREYVATGDIHAVLSLSDAERHMGEALARLRKYGGRAIVHRKASPGAAAGFDDGSLDLVFLDGDHSLVATFADCRAWWPKIKDGGWLGGHDFSNGDPRFKFGVDQAVAMFSDEVGLPFDLDGGLTWWLYKP